MNYDPFPKFVKKLCKRWEEDVKEQYWGGSRGAFSGDKTASIGIPWLLPLQSAWISLLQMLFGESRSAWGNWSLNTIDRYPSVETVHGIYLIVDSIVKYFMQISWFDACWLSHFAIAPANIMAWYVGLQNVKLPQVDIQWVIFFLLCDT